MRFNVFNLKQRLEIEKGYEISWAEIARRAAVHPNTLANLYLNKTRRVDLETMENLIDFFAAEGIEVQPNDFFVVTREMQAA